MWHNAATNLHVYAVHMPLQVDDEDSDAVILDPVPELYANIKAATRSLCCGIGWSPRSSLSWCALAGVHWIR